MSARAEIRQEGRIVREIPLDGRLVIGRSADCDHQIDDESMSKTHLEFSLKGVTVLAMDLGSRNGTIKNGRREQSGVVFRVKDNDVLRLGKTTLKVHNPLDRGDTKVLDPDPDSIRLTPETLLVVKALVKPYRDNPGNPAVRHARRDDVAVASSMSTRHVSRQYETLAAQMKLGEHDPKDRGYLLASKILELGLDLREG